MYTIVTVVSGDVLLPPILIGIMMYVSVAYTFVWLVRI